MFSSKNKKNNVYPCKPRFYNIKGGLRCSKLCMFSWCLQTNEAVRIRWTRTTVSSNSDVFYIKKCFWKAWNFLTRLIAWVYLWVYMTVGCVRICYHLNYRNVREFCQNYITSSEKKERICLLSPFNADPFLEGNWCAVGHTGSHKSCLPC